jgi:hypothetical protein
VFSGSLTSTAGFTGSFSGTATSASFASTASFVANAQSASYVLNAISSSFATSAVTASYADSLTVTGTLTAQTLVVQTITSSVDFVTGSTRFGSILGNTHQFTGSVSMTGSLAVRAANSSFGLSYYNAAGTLTAGFYNTSTGHGQLYLYNSSSTQTVQIDGSGGSATFLSSVTSQDVFSAYSGFRNYTGGAARGGMYTYATITGAGTDYSNTLFAETGYGIYFCPNGSVTKVMSITSAGVALIGTSTSAGGVLNTYKAPVASNFVDQIVVQSTGNYPSLRLGTYDAYDAVIATTGNDLRILAGLNVTTENHDIRFYTSFIGCTTGAQNYERMRITSTGRVGVGTTSPSQNFAVVGAIKSSVSTTDGAAIAVAYGRTLYKVFVSSNYDGGNAVRAGEWNVLTNNEGTGITNTTQIYNYNSQSATFSVSGGNIIISGLSGGNNQAAVFTN